MSPDRVAVQYPILRFRPASRSDSQTRSPGSVCLDSGFGTAAQDRLNMASTKKLGRRLSRAALEGEIIDVERLLAEGADPNFESTFCWKPLRSTHDAGYAEITHAVADKGACEHPI